MPQSTYGQNILFHLSFSVSYKNLYNLLMDIKLGDRKNIIDLVNEFGVNCNVNALV